MAHNIIPAFLCTASSVLYSFLLIQAFFCGEASLRTFVCIPGSIPIHNNPLLRYCHAVLSLRLKQSTAFSIKSHYNTSTRLPAYMYMYTTNTWLPYPPIIHNLASFLPTIMILIVWHKSSLTGELMAVFGHDSKSSREQLS